MCYTYDTLSRLLSVLHQAGGSTIDGEAYTLDAAGNRTAKMDYLAGVTSDFTYDKIYELTQVTQGTTTDLPGSTRRRPGSPFWESYSGVYPERSQGNAVGNRLSSLGVSPYSYNTSNELTSTPSGSYTYDYNGNTLTDASGRSYTWDFENRLTQVTMPNSGGTATFKYDPFGQRIQKVFTQNSTTTTTNYLYDGDNAIETVDQNGNVLTKFAQGQNIDEPLAESVGGAAYDYEQDGLGSVSSLTNSTGALSLTYTYDSFGKITNSQGSVSNPFRYTGRDFDSETGLYYYRARYYDPTTGRFLSEDLVGVAGEQNFYDYVLNDGVNLDDPFGLCPWDPECHCGCKKCHIIHMLVTGYDNSYQSTGKNPGNPGYGITTSGAKAGPGTVAAPRRFPFGTGMFVPGYGCGKVQDRGGAIKGQHIDVWFSSTKEAMNWGKHHNVPVEVCDDPR